MGEDEWYEDRQFWETFKDHMFPPESIEKAKEEIEQIIELAEIEKDEKVLDLPCGVGRHAIPLAEKGHKVTGVDLTEPYIEEAKEKAEESGLDIDFKVEDMRGFTEGTYDVILHLWNSFGYFEDRDDDRKTAENFYQLLNEDGRLVMDISTKETIAKGFKPKIWDEKDDRYFLQKREIKDDWNWIEYEVIVVNGDKKEVHDMSHRLYSARELKTLLKEAGFSKIETYGDFEGEEYDQDAETLIMVAEK